MLMLRVFFSSPGVHAVRKRGTREPIIPCFSPFRGGGRCLIVPFAAGLLAIQRARGGGLYGLGLRVLQADLRATSRQRPASAVLPKFDTESTKTVGLAEAIVARVRPAALRRVLEQRNPPHLAAGQLGLLAAYRPAGRQGLPRRLPLPGKAFGTASPPGPGCCWSIRSWCPRQSGRESILDLADPRVAGPGGDRQAPVRHHRHPGRLPVRRLGRRTGQGVLPSV